MIMIRKPETTLRLAAVLLLAAAILATALGLIGQAGPTQAAQSDSRFERLVLTATGSEGSATGVVTSGNRLTGFIRGIHVDYASGLTTTTDLAVGTVNPAATVETLSNSATDGWTYPSVQLTGSTGAAVTGAYDRFFVDDYLTVSASQASSGTVATVTVYYGN